MDSPGRRRFPQVAWACASSPLGLLVMYAAFGLHLRIGLGHWPMPMVEDYRTPIFILHEWVLIGSLVFAYVLAVPGYLVCLVIPALRPVTRVGWGQVSVWILGWVLFFGAVKFDPTTFSAWFAD